MSRTTKIINYFQKNRVLQHLLFWMLILLMNVQKGIFAYQKPFFEVFSYYCFVIIFQIIISYFLAYYVVPKFLLKKRYIFAILLLLIIVYVFSALYEIIRVHIYIPLFKNKTPESVFKILTDWRLVLKNYPTLLSSVLIFLFAKYFISYKKTKEKELLLSKGKAENELKVLKAQLNPHFLFNTLNNIYTLSLRNSPKTPTSIGKLSNILDHILYRCNGTFVSLSSEIELLKNYIELEKLRYDERLKVNIHTNIESDREIPPLILLSLVENAFKHGAGEDSGSPEIDIQISNTEALFVFKIINTVSSDYENINKGNIGLLNIRKQLDLIYNETYCLNIEDLENSFTVVLEIPQQ